jgi:hypothetical protein
MTAPTLPAAVDTLPTPPTTSDPATFDARADASMLAQQSMVPQINAATENVYDNALSAHDSAVAALASENAAAASSGATIWVSGATYAIGDCRFSPINFQSYRRKTAGAGSTDPSLDASNWALVVGVGLTTSRVQGLLGTPNAATPLTKCDLSADSVTLRNAAGGTVARYVTGTITNDLGLAGITANGRDQAAAFPINSWVYEYFIWNGAALATISSLAVPTVGPALPTGYTHWAFATALRWNASSNIIPVRTMGSSTWYDLPDAGVNRVLTAGVAATMTAVNCSGFVPPIATKGTFSFLVSLSHSAVSNFRLDVRPTGAAAAKVRACVASVQVAGALIATQNTFSLPLGASTQIDYLLDIAPSGAGGAYIDVTGFTIPNGDA